MDEVACKRGSPWFVANQGPTHRNHAMIARRKKKQLVLSNETAELVTKAMTIRTKSHLLSHLWTFVDVYHFSQKKSEMTWHDMECKAHHSLYNSQFTRMCDPCHQQGNHLLSFTIVFICSQQNVQSQPKKTANLAPHWGLACNIWLKNHFPTQHIPRDIHVQMKGYTFT